MAYYTLLTNIGKAKLANATALGTTVQLTHIAVGDGNGAAITPVDTATVLTHEVWRAALNSITVDPNNSNWVVAEGYIPSTSGGFTVREVGLFDIDGDMIAIGSYPDTYKPTLAAGSAKDLYIKVIIEVTNSSTVTLKIDPAVVLSTRSYVDSKVVEHEAKADPHPQYLTIDKIHAAPFESTLGGNDEWAIWDSFTGLMRKISVTGFISYLASTFAPIASPAFTGNPTAPTPATGDSDTSIATSEFVMKKSGALSSLKLFHIQIQKAAGTADVSPVSGWNTRGLNTVLSNGISGASLANPTITLPAGTYYCEGEASSMLCNSHRVALYNVTDATYPLLGTSQHSRRVEDGYDAMATTTSKLTGVFTISATKTFQLKHYISNAYSFGAGSASGLVEIFADVKFWKVD